MIWGHAMWWTCPGHMTYPTKLMKIQLRFSINCNEWLCSKDVMSHGAVISNILEIGMILPSTIHIVCRWMYVHFLVIFVYNWCSLSIAIGFNRNISWNSFYYGSYLVNVPLMNKRLDIKWSMNSLSQLYMFYI